VSTTRREDGRSPRLSEDLQWVAPDGTSLLSERRTLDVFRAADPGVTLLTWRSRLRPAEGLAAAKLTGTHYGGLGARFIESMDQVGRFLHAADERGPAVRGAEHVTPSKWTAYVAPADGKPVTVAMFDHPDNPRHPAGMFTMLKPFAYLSATPNIWKTPLELRRGEALDLCYGVAVWDGEAPAAQIETLYGRWLKLTRSPKP
jgi:hypothetical protein